MWETISFIYLITSDNARLQDKKVSMGLHIAHYIYVIMGLALHISNGI